MSRSRRARVDTLIKRADYLENRIHEASLNGKNLTYDKQEARAIRWAVPILDAHCTACQVLQEQLKEEKLERS